jgi:hypothetical protein
MEHRLQDHSLSGSPGSFAPSLGKDVRDQQTRADQGRGGLVRTIALLSAYAQIRHDMALMALRKPSLSKPLNMACPMPTDTPEKDGDFHAPIAAVSAIRHTAEQSLTWATAPLCQCMAPLRHADADAVSMKPTFRYKKLKEHQHF